MSIFHLWTQKLCKRWFLKSGSYRSALKPKKIIQKGVTVKKNS